MINQGIGVRFPEGYYLQGTFSVYENLSAVYEFVKSCLTDENAQFILVGTRITRIQPEVDHSSIEKCEEFNDSHSLHRLQEGLQQHQAQRYIRNIGRTGMPHQS